MFFLSHHRWLIQLFSDIYHQTHSTKAFHNLSLSHFFLYNFHNFIKKSVEQLWFFFFWLFLSKTILSHKNNFFMDFPKALFQHLQKNWNQINRHSANSKPKRLNRREKTKLTKLVLAKSLLNKMLLKREIIESEREENGKRKNLDRRKYNIRTRTHRLFIV